MEKKENVTQTKRKILLTAEKLFANQGYRNVSMNEIAEEVKITKPALYHYFKDKRELYFNILDNAFDELDILIEGVISEKLPSDEKLKLFVTTFLEFSIEKKDLAMLVMQKIAEEDKSILKYIIKRKLKNIKKIKLLVKEILKDKRSNQKLNIDFATYAIAGIVNSVATVVMSESLVGKKVYKVKLSKIADQVVILFFPSKKSK